MSVIMSPCSFYGLVVVVPPGPKAARVAESRKIGRSRTTAQNVLLEYGEALTDKVV